MHRMRRMDPYNTNLREEQKAILNALLGFIYDSYDTTRRIEKTVEGIYKIVFALLVIVILVLCLLAVAAWRLRYISPEEAKQHQSRYNTFPLDSESEDEKLH